MKPSDFRTHPYDSIFQNSESETVARNIMAILARTGDTWRQMEWHEYETEREKDGNFSFAESTYFGKVVKFCASAETAQLFSPAWEKK